MMLIWFWCLMTTASSWAQEDEYYVPQTFKQQKPTYHRGLFTPSGKNEVNQLGIFSEQWRSAQPAPVTEQWREPESGSISPFLMKTEPWRPPYQASKEQRASIIHHKQSLSSEGGFRFEYASDNGLAAGEVIEPDGSRVGAYQYKDPSGQLVKMKYRAGIGGFQILEGSHLPKSPEPVAPPTTDFHHQQAYEEQRQQYGLQQQYNQRPSLKQHLGEQNGRPFVDQHYHQSWQPEGQEDNGQYRENEVMEDRAPHTFGEGYSFAFQG